MSLSKESFQSFWDDIQELWKSPEISSRRTKKQLVSILTYAILRNTKIEDEDALFSVRIKKEIDALVSSWRDVFPEEELPWLLMYSRQEEEGLNPIITGFEATLINHLSVREERCGALMCSFISPGIIEFAKKKGIEIVPVIDKHYYIPEHLASELSAPYHILLSDDWVPNKKGVVLSPIVGCDKISTEAGRFVCRNGGYVLFDTEEYFDGTLMSDLSDGWKMTVKYGYVFTNNISTIREYFTGGCLHTVECGTCRTGQKELFLKGSDFRPAAFCDYQIDTSENNICLAQEGDRYLEQPAIIVSLSSLEVYVHTSRLRIGIPKRIFEDSAILVPDYVDSMFCRSSLLKTARDLHCIFSQRDRGFEGFKKNIRHFWLEKARTGRYDMDDPIASIGCHIKSPDRRAEFETMMRKLAVIPMNAHRGLDSECAGILHEVQKEYGINDDVSAPSDAWAQFWTLDPKKLQKGSETYRRKDHQPHSIIMERIQRGEWPLDFNPIEDLASFINSKKAERSEFVNLMRNIRSVYKSQAKTKPSDRIRIMDAVDKHFELQVGDWDKNDSPIRKAFTAKVSWEKFHRQAWNAFWELKKEDVPTGTSRKVLEFDDLLEKIHSGEWPLKKEN